LQVYRSIDLQWSNVGIIVLNLDRIINGAGAVAVKIRSY
jgi:hypothetical protein